MFSRNPQSCMSTKLNHFVFILWDRGLRETGSCTYGWWSAQWCRLWSEHSHCLSSWTCQVSLVATKNPYEHKHVVMQDLFCVLHWPIGQEMHWVYTFMHHAWFTYTCNHKGRQVGKLAHTISFQIFFCR